jgi:hypothetical protein
MVSAYFPYFQYWCNRIVIWLGFLLLYIIYSKSCCYFLGDLLCLGFLKTSPNYSNHNWWTTTFRPTNGYISTNGCVITWIFVQSIVYSPTIPSIMWCGEDEGETRPYPIRTVAFLFSGLIKKLLEQNRVPLKWRARSHTIFVRRYFNIVPLYSDRLKVSLTIVR